MTRLIASLAIIASTSLHSIAQNFTDPNPPTVNELKSLPSPDPISQSELTFHRAPKPLPGNAITEDWMDFLGPTHNAISQETGLLSDSQKRPKYRLGSKERGRLCCPSGN